MRKIKRMMQQKLTDGSGGVTDGGLCHGEPAGERYGLLLIGEGVLVGEEPNFYTTC